MLPEPEHWTIGWEKGEKMDSNDKIVGLGISLNSIIFMVAFYMLLKEIF